MTRDEILEWLREADQTRLDELWSRADAARRRFVGDQVHLRGLIEISNHCVRRCHYCGLRAPNKQLTRYRMTQEEIVACARRARDYGYGTVVIQAGEDPGLSASWVAELVRRLKADTDLAVTLSLGERSRPELAAWRQAGADRYFLRFETSNQQLYESIHPPRGNVRSDRFAILEQARELGYEIGSGVMIGIPGQTYADLANDIIAFGDLDLDMVGVGPFLPHPDTPLGTAAQQPAGDDQVPNNESMTYKVIALTRLVCPRSNLPSTTALATLDPISGHRLGLLRGANVVMPNLTPAEYRRLYEIYPGKAHRSQTSEQAHGRLQQTIQSLGRTIGKGRGDSPNYRRSDPRQTNVG